MGLEKHVEDLSFEQNPLPVLPDKWHLRFGPQQEASRPAGYTTTEVPVRRMRPVEDRYVCSSEGNPTKVPSSKDKR